MPASPAPTIPAGDPLVVDLVNAIRGGADIDWVGHDDLTAIDAARRSAAHELAGWLRTRGARSAADTT